MTLEKNNLIDRLETFALNIPQKEALIFLQNDMESTSLSYANLHQRAGQIATLLKSKALQQPILLLYPTGLDFIPAFIGCLYSLNIAVPITSPAGINLNKMLPVIDTVIRDANIQILLTTSAIKKIILQNSEKFPCFKTLSIIDTTLELVEVDTFFEKMPNHPDDIVYLQYTSGSTSNPKGAVITHRTLIKSLVETSNRWHYTNTTNSYTWAPHTHVYGLIVGLLVPIFNGNLTIISSPQSFVLEPLNWLKAISTYKITHSGCPNFGYEHCLQSVPEDELAGLDLSSWIVAINGGEPVQKNTLIQFSKKFSSYGFQLKYFYPAYGISELCGLTSTKLFAADTVIYDVALSDLTKNKITPAKNITDTKSLVSSGVPLSDIDVKIVDPETNRVLNEGEIGEIWIAGEQCFAGYWPDTKRKGEYFATLSNTDQTRYFKSGDLGFIKNDELFLTGRLKELIIIYGKNYYPLDIEILAKQAHENLSKQVSIAFSLEVKDKEELFIIQELGNINLEEIPRTADSIREKVFTNLGIDVYGIILVKNGSLPKTISGKIQRNLCKKLFIENKLDNIVFQSIL